MTLSPSSTPNICPAPLQRGIPHTPHTVSDKGPELTRNFCIGSGFLVVWGVQALGTTVYTIEKSFNRPKTTANIKFISNPIFVLQYSISPYNTSLPTPLKYGINRKTGSSFFSHYFRNVKIKKQTGMVTHSYNPSTTEATFFKKKRLTVKSKKNPFPHHIHTTAFPFPLPFTFN